MGTRGSAGTFSVASAKAFGPCAAQATKALPNHLQSTLDASGGQKIEHEKDLTIDDSNSPLIDGCA
jgi:hypothetical protein